MKRTFCFLGWRATCCVAALLLHAAGCSDDEKAPFAPRTSASGVEGSAGSGTKPGKVVETPRHDAGSNERDDDDDDNTPPPGNARAPTAFLQGFFNPSKVYVAVYSGIYLANDLDVMIGPSESFLAIDPESRRIFVPGGVENQLYQFIPRKWRDHDRVSPDAESVEWPEIPTKCGMERSLTGVWTRPDAPGWIYRCSTSSDVDTYYDALERPVTIPGELVHIGYDGHLLIALEDGLYVVDKEGKQTFATDQSMSKWNAAVRATPQGFLFVSQLVIFNGSKTVVRWHISNEGLAGPDGEYKLPDGYFPPNPGTERCGIEAGGDAYCALQKESEPENAALTYIVRLSLDANPTIIGPSPDDFQRFITGP